MENVETVIAQNGIQNVDKVMECVGAKVTMRTAFEVAGKCATIVLFGLGKEEKPSIFIHMKHLEKN